MSGLAWTEQKSARSKVDGRSDRPGVLISRVHRRWCRYIDRGRHLNIMDLA